MNSLGLQVPSHPYAHRFDIGGNSLFFEACKTK
jgi:hypothetical protein